LIIARNRYEIHYGQEQARLSRDMSIISGEDLVNSHSDLLPYSYDAFIPSNMKELQNRIMMFVEFLVYRLDFCYGF